MSTTDVFPTTSFTASATVKSESKRKLASRGNYLLTYLLSLLTISGLAVVLFEKLIIKFVHFFTIQSQGIEQTTNLEVL